MADRGQKKSKSFLKKFINWKSILLFWLAFTSIPCLLNLVTSQFSKWAKPISYIFKTEMIASAVWLLLTPLVFWLAGRFPIFGKKRYINMLIHIILGIIVPLIDAFIFLFPYRAFISLEEVEFFDHLVILLDYHLYGGVLIYWFLVLIYHVFAYADRYRQEERVASRARESLANSRLEMLKAQLRPHFLFNSLHTIGSLVRKDQKEPALNTLSDLGELLRKSLYSGGSQITTLSEELSFIKSYLKIEMQRFQDRLTVEYRIDPCVEESLVPSFFLQPLVENAIKHGICGIHDSGQLEIIAGRENNRLHIEIIDDGPGLSESYYLGHGPGVGLRNTQERLKQIYGENFSFVIKNRSVRGTAVIINIPLAASKEEDIRK